MNTVVPASLDHLLRLLAQNEPGNVLLAGGTDFNVQVRKGILAPRRVLYMGGLSELQGVRMQGGRLRLGALLTFGQLARDELLLRHTPALCRHLGEFASPPVRNLATLGGNIANASPTADSLPPLLVRRAVLELTSLRGMREVPLHEFFTGYKRNVMAPDELISAILLPADCEQGLRAFWRKVGTRRALIIAKLSLAGLARVENGRLAECRVAAGALNEYPRRLAAVEALLLATPLEQIARAALHEALASDVTPIDDLRSDADYRFETCLNLLESWLHELSGR